MMDFANMLKSAISGSKWWLSNNNVNDLFLIKMIFKMTIDSFMETSSFVKITSPPINFKAACPFWHELAQIGTFWHYYL